MVWPGGAFPVPASPAASVLLRVSPGSEPAGPPVAGSSCVEGAAGEAGAGDGGLAPRAFGFCASPVMPWNPESPFGRCPVGSWLAAGGSAPDCPSVSRDMARCLPPPLEKGGG